MYENNEDSPEQEQTAVLGHAHAIPAAAQGMHAGTYMLTAGAAVMVTAVAVPTSWVPALLNVRDVGDLRIKRVQSVGDDREERVGVRLGYGEGGVGGWGTSVGKCARALRRTQLRP